MSRALPDDDRIDRKAHVRACPRSDIQAGISIDRSISEPSNVQRKTTPSALVDRRMNEDIVRKPQMKSIQDLSADDPVGVLKPRCITGNVLILP